MADEKPDTCHAVIAKGKRKGEECGRQTMPGRGTCWKHSPEGLARLAQNGRASARKTAQTKATKAGNKPFDPLAIPETPPVSSWQELIDRCVKRADERAQAFDFEEERRYLAQVGTHMKARDEIELAGLKLHFDAPPLTVIFEGLADAPPASFPPPPSGASDDPIAGVTPLPVRQGGT